MPRKVESRRPRDPRLTRTLKALAGLMALSGISRRKIQARCADRGVGVDLAGVLRGNLCLRMSHILVILDSIEMDPAEFFRITFKDPADSSPLQRELDEYLAIRKEASRQRPEVPRLSLPAPRPVLVSKHLLALQPSPDEPSDAFRETTLMYIDDPADRAAVRRVGQLIHDVAVEATAFPPEESIAHRELRAAAAELRYLERFLNSVRQSAQESALPPEEEALTQFAGRLARQVGDVAAVIEGRL